MADLAPNPEMNDNLKDDEKVVLGQQEASIHNSSLVKGEDILAQQDIDPALNAKMFIVNNTIDEIGWTPYHWKLFVLNGFGYAVDSMLLLLQSIIATSAANEFSPSYARALTIAVYVGMLLGALFWGLSADIIGRKFAFNTSLFVCSVAATVAGAAPSWNSLSFFIAVLGFGGGGNLVLDTTVFLEYLPSHKQWVLTLLAAWWGLGQAVAGFLAWGFMSPTKWNCTLPDCTYANNKGWRYLMYSSGAIVFVMSILRITVIRLRETPKYLLGEGKDERVVEGFQKLATKYNRPCSISFEMLDACGVVASAHGKSRVSISELTIHFRGLFATKKIGFSTVLIWLSWTLIGLAYPLFYVFLSTYLATRSANIEVTSTYVTWRNYALVNISGIPGPMLAGVMCNWKVLGRRYTMVIGALITMAFFFAYTQVRTQAQNVGFSCSIAFFLNVYYGTLYAYTPEVLPSAHRATGNGIAVACNRIMGILSAVIATVANTATSVPIYICAAFYRTLEVGKRSFTSNSNDTLELELLTRLAINSYYERTWDCPIFFMMAPTQDTMFRSADMSMVQLYIANEIGREIVNALGELGQIQFRDLNSETTAFQRTFTQEIRRLDNVERQLRYFHSQMEKAGIPLRKLDLDVDTLAAPSATEIDELSGRSQSLEQRIASLNDSYETLKTREMELTEWRWVLREAGGFFDRAHGNVEDIRVSTDNDDAPLLQDIEQHQNGQNGDAERSFSVMNIGFVAGVIPRDRVAAFERILWRTLRGNLYMNQSEIPEPLIDPTNNEAINKNVFVIFAHGKEIIAKIRKISESLGADLYSVDENSDLRRDQVHEVNTRLSDLNNVLRNTKQTLDAELTQIARSLAAWMVIIKKEKAVYQTLNLFSYDHARKTLIAEAWCPSNSLPLIKSTLHDVNNRAGLSVPSIINEIRTNKTPPTYQKTNKFTEGFQTIINAYGTAKYQEVNPGLPTIVTFPFLFAVMFGDFGHGFLMVCAASAMIYWEKPLKKVRDELFSMAYYGRYIMLMMGIFSMYTGLIYNDVFSKSLSIFPSAWEWADDYPETVTAHLKESTGYRYPFGLDWMWHGTENNLLFTNSYKMKLSILMGWCHMTYSLCLSYINARHFKSPIDIWGVFVPGMIFFQGIFGYLVFTIIYKWSIDWYAIGESPPGLLNMLIYMFLSPGTVDEPLYPGQKYVQQILVLVAIIQVPILLFLKPFYLRWEHNKARAQGYRGIGETSRVSALDGDDDSNTLDGRASLASDGEGVAMITQDIGDEEHEEFEFGEVMIHQVIHTIEFCLNCVSHTASYLRLWALSLAHQQLSVVLWSMTLQIGLSTTGVIGVPLLVVTFFVWFFLTIAVLVVMEGTSAMLHSLRLHWVEAMSKHFMGDGIAFEPFSFKQMLEEDGATADIQ